jgi:DNA gyrase subunit A
MAADLGVTDSSRYIKSAAVVGEVMKSYHPHGGEAIYDALVRMSQAWVLRYPLVEGYGNFGSIDGDPPAAMRYTECRLTPLVMELLAELRQATVDFRPNYSATEEEPVVLPSRVPELLLNGASGIAVGMATNIPPHNLTEVCKALVGLLDHDRDLPLERILKYIPGPDFPSGGVILNTPEEIKQIYATGQGAIKLRGRYEHDPKRETHLYITSIPYGIEKDPLVQRIGELIAKGQLPQLTNVKDLSTEDIRIQLELRPGARAEAAMAYLYKNTSLQTNFNVNLTCLLPADGAEFAVPDRLDLKSILVHFLDFRLQIVTRRLQHELENLKKRIHILEGFAIVFNHLDEAIKIIRASDGKADAAPKLMARFGLSDLQADAVLETKLYRLGKLEIRDILTELKEKRARAKEIEKLLKDEGGRWAIVREEIKAVSKTYGDARRTRIEAESEPVEFREEDYIVDEDAWVIVSRDGWIKRQKSFTDIPSIRVRDDDHVGWVFRSKARQTITFFTDKAVAYTIRANDIPLTTGYGEPIQGHVALDDQEHVVGVACHDPRCLPHASRCAAAEIAAARHQASERPKQGALFVDEKRRNGKSHDQSNGHPNGNGEDAPPPPPYAVALTASGKCLRFPLAPLAALSTRKGRQVVRLDAAFANDLVIGVEVSDSTENVCLATRCARVLIFPVTEINVVSGAAKGVLAVKLEKNDRVLGFTLAGKVREGLRVRTSRGGEQIVRATRYEVASRGGKGHAILQRGSLEAVLAEEPKPVPPMEEIVE